MKYLVFGAHCMSRHGYLVDTSVPPPMPMRITITDSSVLTVMFWSLVLLYFFRYRSHDSDHYQISVALLDVPSTGLFEGC